MNRKIFFLVVFGILTASELLLAEERIAIWPEGKTPYALPVDVSTGSPSLGLYTTRGKVGHTGAAVVICPGGGYGGLAKDHEGHQPAQWFNEQGVSAFVLHYRLGPQGHHYPTQLADVQRAIRWVRSHSDEYGIDPKRIAVMGFSAGGHLASMAATLFDEKAYIDSDTVDAVSSRPDFAILCYPVISFDSTITHAGSRRNLLGADRANSEEWAKKLSSELNVSDKTPRTFIFQTDADTGVPAENATRFYLALRSKKIPAEYHSFQNGPHGVGLYRGDPTLGVWSDLLRNWLKANGFYSGMVMRSNVSGEVTLDGKPVSWGAICFEPENPNYPVTTVRVRNGKFAAKGEEGPVVGRCRIKFEGSIWETTNSADDRVVRLESLSPKDGSKVTLEVTNNMSALQFDYHSR